MLDVTRNASGGRRVFLPRGGYLSFSFDLGPRDRPPDDPRLVLETAVAAHHAAGLPGRYAIISSEPYYHIVPVARTSERGRIETIHNPLDTLITLERATRSARVLLADLVQSVNRLSQLRVATAMSPFSEGIQPEIDDGFENIPARDILRALINASGKTRTWYLMYVSVR